MKPTKLDKKFELQKFHGLKTTFQKALLQLLDSQKGEKTVLFQLERIT